MPFIRRFLRAPEREMPFSFVHLTLPEQTLRRPRDEAPHRAIVRIALEGIERSAQ